MNWKQVDRLVAGAVFAYALVLYLLTVAPSASFWDVGEYIAAVHGLQVSHPPGAPFFMLVGHLFTMFVPADYVALAANLLSVLASALTVLLTHLTVVRLVRMWQDRPAAEQAWTERIVALGGGVVGAATFAATDSFWFNAVEAEVYALSMFFTAVVVWLVMRWSEQARTEEARLARGGGSFFDLHANRYLVLIAYLIGLAIGVHLLNLLALFFVALIVFFTAYDRPTWDAKTRWKWLVVTGVVSSLIFFVIYPGIIQLLPAAAGASGVPLVFFLGTFALAAAAVYYTQRARRPAWNLVALCLLMVLIGYSTYALIFIRSAADPPIDLNDPETPEAFVSYLAREQYGSTPLLSGPAYDDGLGRVDLSDEVLFPRRWSPSPSHERVYAQYDSGFEFFWEYQVGHMYGRYFLWNFSGRASDAQGAPGIILPVNQPDEEAAFEETPSEEASRNVYYALPLLLGLFGMLYHFSRDWRMAFSVSVLFFVTGLGIILYLNQTPLQPRERDYSYVASFFAFSLWIGIGAAGLAEMVRDALQRRLGPAALRGSLVGVLALAFLASPLNMVTENYFDHDRSGRYAAPDYAYNLLHSLAPNAILFTNGDNDTYPLWYLQEVEGVRPDVRVVNLSLLQTPWYIDQLKNEWARTSAPLPITLDPQQVQPRALPEPVTGELPVDLQARVQDRDTTLGLAPQDTSRIQSPMRWTIEGRPYSQDMNVLYANDLVVYNMLRTNAQNGWERPIYFAVTTATEGQLNLQEYFQLEGQAFRVLPIPFGDQLGNVTETTYERMMDFRFRNLSNPDVYYDEVIRSMLNYYRTWFAHAAQQLAQQGETEQARDLLDKISEMSFDVIPGTAQSYLLMAQAHQAAGQDERAVELLARVEPILLRDLRQARSQQAMAYASQYVQMIRYAYLDAGAFNEAASLSQALADLVGDPSMAQTADQLRRTYRSASDSLAADSLAMDSLARDNAAADSAALLRSN